jgi:hypothetical protein
MNPNHVIDSWIAELRLAPRRRRRRQTEDAVTAAADQRRAGRKAYKDGYPSIPAIAIQAAAKP